MEWIMSLKKSMRKRLAGNNVWAKPNNKSKLFGLMTTSVLSKGPLAVISILANNVRLPIMTLTAAGFVILSAPATAQSSLPTFTCEADAYNVFGSTPTNLQRFDPATLSVISTIGLNPGIEANAVGFNPLDNYMYGLISDDNGIAGFTRDDFVRIAVDGSVETVGSPSPETAGLPPFAPSRFAGVMDAAGNWYGISNSHVFIVNIGNTPANGALTYRAIPRTGFTNNILDIAFNPSDGDLYGIAGNQLRRINVATGNVSTVPTVGDPTQNSGGAWSISDGTLFFYRNGGGSPSLSSVDTSQSPALVTNLGPVPGNPNFDSAACLPPTLTKGVLGSGPDANGRFSYEFTISNAFSNPISVNFNDPLPAELQYVPGTLSPASPGGGTVTTFNTTDLAISNVQIPTIGTTTFSVTVELAPGLTAGTPVVNQAMIEFGGSTIPSDDPGTATSNDGTNVTVTSTPSLTLDKPSPVNADEDGSGTVSVGDTLTYTITATNDGNTALNNVTITDPLLNAPNDTTTCSSVAVGATCVLSGTYVVTTADATAGTIDNTANVASDEITTPVEAAQSTAVAAFANSPSLSMTKTADSSSAYAPGDIVVYTYTVENDGDVDISDVTLSDTHNGSAPLGDITISTLTNTSGQSSDDGADAVVDVLAPGDIVEFTAEYVVTATDLISGGPVTNTASVTGTPDAGTLSPATANETISVTGTPRPDLTPGVCGGFVREGFLVDPGVPATEVNADFGSGLSGPTPFDPYVIAPFIGRNQSTGVVSFYQASADASDSGSFLSNGVVLNGPSGLTSTLVTAADHTSELWRAAARLEGAPGTTQTITINTGNAHEHTAYWQTDVNGALINTNSSSNAGDDDGWLFGTSTTFAGGDGESYTIDVTYPADGIVILQFALLDSTGGFGGIVFDDYECPTPSISITKVADSTGPHKPGDTVTYTYTVLNDGNQAVNDITVTDSHNGSDPAPVPGSETLITDIAPAGDSTDSGVNGSWDVLAPGDAFTFTGTYIITNDDVIAAADITNTATVIGTPIFGSLPATPITANEVVSVTPLVTDLSITKTNTPGVNSEVDQSGDTLTSGATTEYILTVTNNGPDSVQGAVVTDIVGAGLTCNATDIVTISGDGVPTGSFTIGDLTGAGITLETLADGEAATLTYTCEVN